MQRARAFRLDADDLHSLAVPRGNTGDQSAAADRDQHGIELWRVLLPLEADTALTRDGFGRVVGMHRQRAALRDKRLAPLQCIGVARPADPRVRAITLDARD